MFKLDFIKDLFKLKFMEDKRFYTGLAGLWLCSITEWAGQDIPEFTAPEPVTLIVSSLIALGLYEKIKPIFEMFVAKKDG